MTLPRRATLAAFAICYVLAMFGAFSAFVPLFALILPQKISTLPGLDGRSGLAALSWILVAGGVAAGGGNIVAGVISDALFRRTQSRRGLVAAGTTAVAAVLSGVAMARTFAELMGAIVVFQLAVNLMLSPLVALLVDYVPDHQKGRVAGWLGLALPFGSLIVTALTIVAPAAGPTVSLFIAVGVVVLLALPLILLWPVPVLIPARPTPVTARPRQAVILHDFVLAWTARLLVQCAAAAILPYLYFYVADVVRPAGGARAIGSAVGVLAFVFAVMSVAGAVTVGWLSDRLGRRRAPLTVSALLVAASMVALSLAPGWGLTVTAYGCFAAGLAGFLAIDSALVAQLVAANARRATMLGVMNLTNTLPGVLSPIMALAVIGDRFDAMPMVFVMQFAAAGALVAALCGSRIRTLR